MISALSPSDFHRRRLHFTVIVRFPPLPSNTHDRRPRLPTALLYTPRPIRPPCALFCSCLMAETPFRVGVAPGVRPTASSRAVRLATPNVQSPGSPHGGSVGEQYLAELEVELTQSEASDEEFHAPGTAPKPAPWDNSGLSRTSANAKLDAHRKALNRASQAKYRRKCGGHVAAANGDADKKFNIRTLTTLHSSRGGAVHYIQSGDAYMSKAEVIHRSREVTVYFALTLRLPTNTRFEVKAVADNRHIVDEKTGFLAMASFYMKADSWIIRKCVISGEMGDSPMTTNGMRKQGWRRGAVRTAYTD